MFAMHKILREDYLKVQWLIWWSLFKKESEVSTINFKVKDKSHT